MQRALELAQLGKGTVSPNPMVGCVIVHKDTIIGEGWHRKAGEPHAEVHAVNAVKDKSLLSESTVYVTLEPCAHFGKTPPCANLLASFPVKKVIIGSLDPNPQVAGKGIKILKEAGIEVASGVLEEACNVLNKRFFTFMKEKRPYVILKWAQTEDRFIARTNFDSKWISSPMARQLVHKWRTEEDAILVGKNTAKHDNPQLTARDWHGKNPIRIVIDHHLTLAEGLHLWDGAVETLVYHTQGEAKIRDHATYIALPEEHFLEALLHDLHKRQVQSLIVEGGAATLQEWIDHDLWDEARVFTAPKYFGEGIQAPQFATFKQVKKEPVASDELAIFYRR